MINTENLSKMMDIYTTKGSISTKELNELGFLPCDLTRMVHKSNKLERIDRGIYKANTNDLFNYAMKKYNENDIESAYNIMYRLYSDDKDNIYVIYNLFFLSILNEKYDVTFECFDILVNRESNLYRKADIKYYLYLINLGVKNIPEDYINYAKDIRFEDVQVLTGNQELDIPINRLRGNVINNAFTSITIPKEMHSIQEKVEYTLISKASSRQKSERDFIYSCVRKHQYEKLLEYLKEELSYRKYSPYDGCLIKLVNAYFDLVNTRKMPILKSLNSSTLWDAIDDNNFRLAFRLVKEFCDKKGYPYPSNSTYLLLEDINKLIDEIKDEEEKKETPTSKTLPKTCHIDSEDIVKEILELLISGEVSDAYNLAQEYLSDSQNVDYCYLINYLIKISVYEGDKSFSKPMMAISVMKNNTFKFVVSEYILSFYENLAKKKFDVASVYLDILDKAKKQGHTKILIKGMREVLNNAIRESGDKLKRPSYNYVSEEETKFIFNDLNLGFSLDELKDRGIILIDYSKYEKNQYFEKVRNIPNIEVSSIDYHGNQKVLYRYKSNDKLVIEQGVLTLFDNANKETLLGNYENALNILKNILSNTPTVSSKLLYRIGFLYVKLGRKDVAIDYFIASEAFARIENVDISLSSIIENLNTVQEVSVPSENNSFDFDTVFNMSRVIDMVLKERKDLEDVCIELGYRHDEYLKCALYMARAYYHVGDYKTGDLYYKRVVRDKDKTTEVKELMSEIATNKQFYKNREEDKFGLILKKYL